MEPGGIAITEERSAKGVLRVAQYKHKKVGKRYPRISKHDQYVADNFCLW